MAPRLKLRMGLERTPKPLYPSEASFVAQVNRQIKALEADVMDIMEQFDEASNDIMMEALEPTFEKAQNYCPKDTLALVNSGYLEENSFRGQPRVEMGFAKGGFPRYGVYVHEVLEYRHEPPTQAKFLERAMFEDLPQMYTRLADGYKRFMGA